MLEIWPVEEIGSKLENGGTFKHKMICPLCSSEMSRLLDLPKFPLTEKYEVWQPTFEDKGYADQAFLYCEDCNHGMLENIIPDLYGKDYETRTHRSEGATQAVKNFAYFIKKYCEIDPKGTVLDIGGNDASLLRLFSGKHLIGVDPFASEEYEAIKSCVESADLSRFKDHKKIIVSSHTIEHLINPEIMLSKVSEIMGKEDVLALQFPSLELLVENSRFDQVHHQHIHYFSERSITAFLARHGLAVIHSRFDDSHWGALMVICKKGGGFISGREISKEEVYDSIIQFKEDIGSVYVPQGAIGLGASLMLPVLAYYIPSLRRIQFIADDDPYKSGLRYVNFNKPIMDKYGLEGEDVVITALGSKQAYRNLTTKALLAGARRVILPMHTL